MSSFVEVVNTCIKTCDDAAERFLNLKAQRGVELTAESFAVDDALTDAQESCHSWANRLMDGTYPLGISKELVGKLVATAACDGTCQQFRAELFLAKCTLDPANEQHVTMYYAVLAGFLHDGAFTADIKENLQVCGARGLNPDFESECSKYAVAKLKGDDVSCNKATTDTMITPTMLRDKYDTSFRDDDLTALHAAILKALLGSVLRKVLREILCEDGGCCEHCDETSDEEEERDRKKARTEP